MKKIVYLLLITLLFAGCKKNKNEDKYTTNEVSIKGKWEINGGKVNYFDANGNLVYTELIEYDLKPFLYVKFDGNNKTYTKFNNNTNEKTNTYTYQNGCLTLINRKNSNKIFVAKLTANSMTWQFEPNNNKIVPKNLPPQDPILQQIVKTINYLNLIKVK